MKQIFLYSLFACLISCSKNGKHNIESELLEPIEPLVENKSDTLKEKNYIAIFDEKTEKKITLSKSELKIVNENLVKSVNDYNKELKIKMKQWNEGDKSNKWDYGKEELDLRYYYRQYFVSTNKNGDKIVNVFCFCYYWGDTWKNERIEVSDGGKCFLRTEVNLTKNKTNYFRTNGLA